MVKAVVPPNDEYQLFWGFSFGWGALDAKIDAGPATLTLSIDKAGEAWRQVDAVLITDDEKYVPSGREKSKVSSLVPISAAGRSVGTSPYSDGKPL